MRILVAALAVAALALAGCSGDDPSGPGSTGDGAAAGGHGGHGSLDPSTHLVAPNWTVGQWWTLGSEQAAAPFTHVVSADGGADWVVDTDSPDIAFFDARFDISFLGKVRKSDLAGSQGNERVKFFDFPLTAGKEWTTTWDGQDVKAKAVTVEDGLATIEARLGNGTLYAKYTYDAKAGYFRDYAFYGADGVTVGFAAKLASSGTGFAGDLLRWTLQTKYEAHGPFAPGLTGFTLDTGITDIWMDFHLACTAGAVSVNVGAITGIQQERGYSANGPCPAAIDQTFTLDPPAQDGEQWGSSVVAEPQTTQGTLDVTVITRTATTFKAGSAPA